MAGSCKKTGNLVLGKVDREPGKSHRKKRRTRHLEMPAIRIIGLLLATMLLIGLLLLPAVTGAASGVVLRLSTDSAGNEAYGNSFENAISADGSAVAFRSDASNLLASDSNGVSDVFVKVILSGVTSRISTDSAGNEANGASSSPAISADGRYVAFSSDANNLVPGDTNNSTDIFLKDTTTGATTRVSTDGSGGEANGSSQSPAISADGRYVAFSSAADNLVSGDTNIHYDVFVKDTLTGATTRISTDSSGAQANHDSDQPSLTGDGSKIAFYSRASNLVAGDSNGRRDIFIKDTTTGATTRVSTDSAGNQGNSDSFEPAISADGSKVAFRTDSNNLVAGDTNGAWDIFVKDLATGSTTRVSSRYNGIQANASSYEPAISANGRYIAFHSVASNLIITDTNGKWDIFVKDTATGATARVSTDATGAAGDGNSLSPSITADGFHVAFYSAADNLIPGDTNGVKDVFYASTPACFGSEPDLSLSMGNSYWGSMADYNAGVLSADFQIDNNFGPDAFTVRLTGAQNTNNVTVYDALPRPLGDIATGDNVKFKVRYSVPGGVYNFRTILHVTAYDECSGIHYYPPV